MRKVLEGCEERVLAIVDGLIRFTPRRGQCARCDSPSYVCLAGRIANRVPLQEDTEAIP